MAKGGGKKGFPFENLLCKDLSYWWTNGENDDVFERTRGSGNRATIRAKKGRMTKYGFGDIKFSDPIGKPFIDFFLTEAKRGHDDVNIMDVIDKTSLKKHRKLLGWIEKAEKEREQGERRSKLIIWRRDNAKPVMLMETWVMDKICEYKDSLPPFNMWRLYHKVGDMYLFNFYEWLHWVEPEELTFIIEKH